MNGDEILDVLKEIRDEVRQTNVRLESLEGRVDFMERRLSKGFEQLSERLEELNQVRTEGELRIATQVVELAGINRQIRDGLVTRFQDHDMLLAHEGRIRLLENHITHRPAD